MRKLFAGIITAIIFISISGCNFIQNAYKYNDTNKEFVQYLLKRDYDKAVGHMALDREEMGSQSPENLKAGLSELSGILIENFGENATTRFCSASKSYSSVKEDNTPPNTTVVLMEVVGKNHFAVFRFLQDDISGKILAVRIVSNRYDVPNMLSFWLFLIPVLIVLGFNIYVLVSVKRSNVLHKWRKYLMIIFLNLPTVVYSAVGKLSIVLSIQLMFGISFSLLGYSGSVLKFGIPLGSLYVLWKLKKGLYKTNDTETANEIQIEEVQPNKAEITDNPSNEDHSRFMPPKQD